MAKCDTQYKAMPQTIPQLLKYQLIKAQDMGQRAQEIKAEQNDLSYEKYYKA